jgi:hypothetical protein
MKKKTVINTKRNKWKKRRKMSGWHRQTSKNGREAKIKNITVLPATCIVRYNTAERFRKLCQNRGSGLVQSERNSRRVV